MIFIYIICGFLFGFGIGLGVANVMLRNKSKAELQKDKSLAKTYGIAVWICGIIGGYFGYWLYANNIF